MARDVLPKEPRELANESSKEQPGYPIESYAAEAQQLTQDAFMAMHPRPVLVLAQGNLDAVPRSFQTVAVDMSEHQNRTRETTGYRLQEIAKRAGAPFNERIVVGRTKASDIQADHAQVSKVHAYFVEDKDGWMLIDAGATNGTFVNNQRLAARESRRLTNRAQIAFGPMNFTFYMPSGLYNFLKVHFP